MRHLKLPLFLLAILFLVVAFTLLSVHPRLTKYRISGKIEVINGQAESTKIVFLEEDDKFVPETIEKAHRVFTNKDGSFATDFGTEAQADVQLFILKPGFFPVRYVLETARRQGDKQPIEKPIIVAGQINASPPLSPDSPEAAPALQLFADPCSDKPVAEVARQNIHYLETIQQIRSAYCTRSDRNKMVTATIATLQGIQHESTYFDPSDGLFTHSPSAASKPITEMSTRN